MRISQTPILQAKSQGGLFSQMFVIPAGDNQTSLIILVGCKESGQLGRSLYNDVSMALQAIQEPSNVSELWLPQLKFENSLVTDTLSDLTAVPNKLPTQQQITMQFYSAPLSDGSPVLVPASDSVVIDQPFVVAITNSQVSDAFEMPLVVVEVPRSSWKQSQ